ncbi:NAD(P)H-dependent glycerol-3-phosphate dehydrogenase [Terrilactibacillus sp. BCM23-1]|uniref:Glycerol-3-phosphate dehydrogenase [NAD(P)+] n=1 Tax=Terrilactibacillus tamarindi TaxID=2599694 RepID=A0A6N8CQ86_9BACI|nr:NAD(P)H-dependent glycerol-3-phosphate dehydrogenase [Terrilactibacillus tamarindi]MTT31263.1 NAD(P)H-dependent glycerol-3-phosphate dehydrogenase [Terrilactibacillus tamarindi]
MKKIAVIGSGSWGTALSIVLADNGYRVQLWGHRQNQIDEINRSHTNQRYLPGIPLSDQIIASSDMKLVLKEVDMVVIVVPTKAMREVLTNIRENLDHSVIFVHGSKGIEPGSSKRISEMIEEEIPSDKRQGVVVLSGPSHAEEVCLRHPTTVAVASHSLDAARQVQDAFINNHFRVYTNDDIVGVEIGGALKNIIALGAGISDGLGYGDNAKAALITRGLAEIARLGTKLGANPLTFIGLAGMGDLIVTCTSIHSRNWRCGHLLGKGHNLEEALNEMGMVVEGVRTTKAAHLLAHQENVELPITSAIYNVLFEGKSPKQAVDELMNRDKKDEIGPLFDMLQTKFNQ